MDLIKEINLVSDSRTYTYKLIEDNPPVDKPVVKNNILSNLLEINDYTKSNPFNNICKTSSPFIVRRGFTNLKDYPFETDTDGYPTTPIDGELITSYVSNFVVDDNLLGKTFEVTYQGKGQLRFSRNLKAIVSSPNENKYTVQVSQITKSCWLEIIESDPVDYVRNISFRPLDYQADNYFYPRYLNTVSQYSGFRFMDWAITNKNPSGLWSKRPLTSNFSYVKKGVPLEVICDFVKVTGSKTAWLTIPHTADDDYIENYCLFIKENISPEVTILLEYSNEVWNRAKTPQYSYVDSLGSEPQVIKYLNQVSRMSTIAKTVFGSQNNLKVAFCWQHYGFSGFEFQTRGLNLKDYGVDVVSTAPYLLSKLTRDNDNQSTIEQWLLDNPDSPDTVMQMLYDEITKGGTEGINSVEGGWIKHAHDSLRNWIDYTESQGLEYASYEGGQHIVPDKNTSQNLKNLYADFNRSEYMGLIYRAFLDGFNTITGKAPFAHFLEISNFGNFGFWGAVEELEQKTPKSLALLEA